jgi:hypothetical protein
MARQPVLNGDTKLTARTKWNDNIEELYDLVSSGVTFLGILNDEDSVTGAPSAGDYYKIAEAGTYGGIACAAFDELYYNGAAWQRLPGAGKSYQEWQTHEDADAGAPKPEDEEAVHTLERTYIDIPAVIVQRRCDWDLYIKSVTIDTGVVTVTVGIGSSGSADNLYYDLFVMR